MPLASGPKFIMLHTLEKAKLLVISYQSYTISTQEKMTSVLPPPLLDMTLRQPHYEDDAFDDIGACYHQFAARDFLSRLDGERPDIVLII